MGSSENAIVIIDPNNVTIGGVPAGKLVDVIANHAHDVDDPAHIQIRADLRDAVTAWHAGVEKAHGDQLAKAAADHATALTAAVAKATETLETAHAAALDAVKTKADYHQQKQAGVAQAAHQRATHLEQMVADLGGHEAWLKTVAGKKANLEALLAATKAELDRHNATEAAVVEAGQAQGVL